MHAALEALSAAYGLSEEELSLLTEGGDLRRPCVFYDVTDPQRPLWKFFFGVPSIYGADETLAARVQAVYGERADYDLFYKAEIDAHTGEVVRTLSLPHMPDSLEGQIDIL